MNPNLYGYTKTEIILSFACTMAAFVGMVAVGLWRSRINHLEPRTGHRKMDCTETPNPQGSGGGRSGAGNVEYRRCSNKKCQRATVKQCFKCLRCSRCCRCESF
jgi:hypothetical protein